MIDLDKLKKMKNLKILLLVCQMIWPFLGLLMSASLLIITSGKSKGSVQFQSGMAVNAEVQAYAAIIAQKAEEHGISEYVQYLMAIMMVESGGTGNDPMQSLGTTDLPAEQRIPEMSIEYGVAIFAYLLQRGQEAGVDIDTIIQAYNFGASYIDYVAARGGEHELAFAADFASARCSGQKVMYDNEIAVRENGGWRYNYGNMFYTYLVRQYLAGDPLAADASSAIIGEALKYKGWTYVYGGSNPNTSFDCSGLTAWCYGTVGLALPHSAQGQYDIMQHITLEEAMPGDLVFFTQTVSGGNYITHVGIYVGDNKMFHAGNPIGYADLTGRYWRQHFVCCGRYRE